jgi:hypothetical protein
MKVGFIFGTQKVRIFDRHSLLTAIRRMCYDDVHWKHVCGLGARGPPRLYLQTGFVRLFAGRFGCWFDM